MSTSTGSCSGTPNTSRERSSATRRAARASGYTFFKAINLATHVFFNFTTLPLRWIIYLGILSATVSLALGATFFVRAFLYSVPVGWSSLAVAIFFTGGVILIVLGIIGEYISRIFTLSNERPQSP